MNRNKENTNMSRVSRTSKATLPDYAGENL